MAGGWVRSYRTKAWNGLETLEDILGQGDGSVGEVEAGEPELGSPASM
jgi:hypothetical protein